MKTYFAFASFSYPIGLDVLNPMDRLVEYFIFMSCSLAQNNIWLFALSQFLCRNTDNSVLKIVIYPFFHALVWSILLVRQNECIIKKE